MTDIAFAVGNFAYILIRVLFWAVILRAILSWIPMSRENALNRVLFDITEPILTPLRRIVPRVGFLDITPMIAMILLEVLSGAIPHSPGIPL